MRAFFTSVGGIVVIVLAGLLLAGGATLAYWSFLAPSVAQGRYNTNLHSQQYQSAQIAQERDLVNGYQDTSDPGQKKSIAQQFCAIYPNITAVPADLADAHGTMCG